MAQQFTPKSGDNALPAGEFDIVLPGNKAIPIGANIHGVRGQTIINAPEGPDGYGLSYRGDGLTLRDLIIRKGGLFMDKSGGRNTNITIDNVEFQDIPGECIKFTSGLSHCTITNNLFRGMSSWAIYGYNWDNCVIANNEMMNGQSGMHIDAPGTDPNAHANDLVEQNYGSGLSGAGMEFQGAVKNATIQDNEFANFQTTNNDSKYAWSIPWEHGDGITVRRNRAILPLKSQTPAGGFVRITFELGGKNLDAYDNYSTGGNDVVAINGAGATGKVHDNRFSNYDHFTGNNNGSTCAITNNGPNVQLTWDINRPRPTRNVRYGSTPPPPPNMPIPTITAPPAGTKLVIGQIINAIATDATGISFDLIGDGKGDFAAGTGTTLSARIPDGATPANKIQVKASGPGGNAMQEYPLILDPVVIPPTTDPCASVKADLVTANAKFADTKAKLQAIVGGM